MNLVAAPKKSLSADMTARLMQARAQAEAADAGLWEACAEALEEGTYGDVSAVVGVARSTLQEKMRTLRKRSGSTE